MNRNSGGREPTFIASLILGLLSDAWSSAGSIKKIESLFIISLNRIDVAFMKRINFLSKNPF